MTSVVTQFNLTEWSTNQDQPHVSVNEGIALVLILHLRFKGKGTSTPPGSPAEGDGYIVGSGATGAWSAYAENSIAYYHNGGWHNAPAVNDTVVWVNDGSGNTTLWRYDSGAGSWDELPLVVADETQTLTAGYSHTPHDHTTVSSGTLTLDEADGAFQKLTNGGAFTLEPPANDTSILLKVTNNASAGTITTTSFTKVTGDSLTTTDGHKFLLNIEKFDGDSALHVRALQ